MCGRVRGYQYDETAAFFSYNENANLTIDDNYVDGVSITWECSTQAPLDICWSIKCYIKFYETVDCPCKLNSTAITPPFVDTDYYCESGVELCCPFNSISNEPLWDGQQCNGGEPPCCTHPNMPWFIKTLYATTTEDIELRLCNYYVNFNTDTPLDIIEIFVQ